MQQDYIIAIILGGLFIVPAFLFLIYFIFITCKEEYKERKRARERARDLKEIKEVIDKTLLTRSI